MRLIIFQLRKLDRSNSLAPVDVRAESVPSFLSEKPGLPIGPSQSFNERGRKQARTLLLVEYYLSIILVPGPRFPGQCILSCDLLRLSSTVVDCFIISVGVDVAENGAVEVGSLDS